MISTETSTCPRRLPKNKALPQIWAMLIFMAFFPPPARALAVGRGLADDRTAQRTALKTRSVARRSLVLRIEKSRSCVRSETVLQRIRCATRSRVGERAGRAQPFFSNSCADPNLCQLRNFHQLRPQEALFLSVAPPRILIAAPPGGSFFNSRAP